MNITTQEGDKPVEGKTYFDVAVLTMKILSEGCLTNSTTSIPELNKEIATHDKENQMTRTPYQHLNHKSRHLYQFLLFVSLRNVSKKILMPTQSSLTITIYPNDEVIVKFHKGLILDG